MCFPQALPKPISGLMGTPIKEANAGLNVYRGAETYNTTQRRSGEKKKQPSRGGGEPRESAKSLRFQRS